jgi:hypothetical protein
MDAGGTRVFLRAEPFIAGIEQAHGKYRKIIPISGPVSLKSDIHPNPCIEHEVLVLNATLGGQNTLPAVCQDFRFPVCLGNL